MRAAFALILLLLSPSSQAQLPSFLSCIDQNQSWSNGFSQGAVKSVTYIVSMPVAPAPPVVPIRFAPPTPGWLIGVGGPPDDPTYVPPPGPARNVNILISMPQNVARQYQQLTNAAATFASARQRYHELLLIEGTFCPLLAEDAPFSTTGPPIWSH